MRNDTCWYEYEEHCVFEGGCPYRDSERKCFATDENLLTYEDYLQEKAIRRLHRSTKSEELK